MKPAWSLVLVLAVAASGCLGAPEAPCRGADCQDPASTHEDPSAAATNAVRWEACRGVVGTLEVPASHVASLVPPEFQIRGRSTSTASLLFEAVGCERLATTSAVAPSAGYFHLLARVEPRDPSWAEPGTPSHYSLGLLGAGPEVAPALADLGAAAEAVHATFTSAAAPAGLGVEQWAYIHEAHDVRVEFAASALDAPARDHRVHHWYAGGDGFHRVDVLKAYEVDGLVVQGGLLRAAGPLGAATLAGTVAWTGQAYASLDEVWTAVDATFPAREV